MAMDEVGGVQKGKEGLLRDALEREGMLCFSSGGGGALGALEGMMCAVRC